MDALTAHERAQEAFAEVLANVDPSQLENRSPCTEWDARQVIQHVIGGNQWVQNLAGLDPTALPDELVDAHAVSAAAAHAVFAAPDGLTRTFELPIGPLPGAAFVGVRSGDVLTHAWDLAKATGQTTDLDPEVAALTLDAARARVLPGLRGPGRAFGVEQPPPARGSAADELAAFLGRDVGFQP
jgi:uncharacterized protein (TIGR03086 family)